MTAKLRERGVWFTVEPQDYWDIFMKTGQVADYLSYKKAEQLLRRDEEAHYGETQEDEERPPFL